MTKDRWDETFPFGFCKVKMLALHSWKYLTIFLLIRSNAHYNHQKIFYQLPMALGFYILVQLPVIDFLSVIAGDYHCYQSVHCEMQPSMYDPGTLFLSQDDTSCFLGNAVSGLKPRCIHTLFQKRDQLRSYQCLFLNPYMWRNQNQPPNT